ncbi:InlB B-repeat-containing protein [Paratractidigestivibacter sp.]|uniref:InlB B-repeat-containing protein n=2 Tax=Paratractidigestivibacter sp. TaxID=2847316 RepID=UPI002AC9242E|nr:InlB B-repeat-containing protein [Paratractidigestivibacter sp.]
MATVCKGDTSLTILVAPTRTNYVLEGYYDASPLTVLEATKIAEADGALLPSRSYLTDADGKWAQGGMESVSLYANWIPNSYDLKFDSNKPADASTAMAGSTETMADLKHGNWFKTPTCGYSLPGYKFVAWNTKADGTGTRIEAGAPVSDLEESSPGVATLYATWKPLEYTVTFVGGEAGGSSYTQKMTFDEPATLTASTFMAPAGKTFLGWTNDLAIPNMWRDGAMVTNLCTLSADGKPTGDSLTAMWAGLGHVSIVVTRNGVPASGFANDLMLSDTEGIFGYFDEDTQAPGVYTVSDIPSGVYDVSLVGFDTTGKTIDVESDGTGIAWLEYCDVQVVGDEHCESAFTSSSGSTAVLTDVPVGSTRDIAVSKHDTGYHFSKYTATGTDPTWQGGDAALGSQAITVNGQTTITAHSAANLYTVTFDPNGGTGTMAAQEFTYDSPQKLSPNTLTKAGAKFKCWTLARDGSDEEFTDAQEAINLSSEEDGEVTLYAQWEDLSYSVTFDSAGGTDVRGKTGLGPDARVLEGVEAPTRAGYRFASWKCGDVDVTADMTLAQLSPNDAEVTLTAQWEALAYSVTFAETGDSVIAAKTGLSSDSKVLEGVEAPTRAGYRFLGWKLGDTDVTEKTTCAELSPNDADIVLVAQWEKVVAPVPAGGDDKKAEPSKKKPSVPATGEADVTAMAAAALLAGGSALAGAKAIRRRR